MNYKFDLSTKYDKSVVDLEIYRHVGWSLQGGCMTSFWYQLRALVTHVAKHVNILTKTVAKVGVSANKVNET